MRREETEERSPFGDPVPLGSDEKDPPAPVHLSCPVLGPLAPGPGQGQEGQGGVEDPLGSGLSGNQRRQVMALAHPSPPCQPGTLTPW